MKRQIRRLEDPGLRCVDLVHEEMQRIIQHSFAHVSIVSKMAVWKEKNGRFSPCMYRKTYPFVADQQTNFVDSHLLSR